jgi:hypothetical protein
MINWGPHPTKTGKAEFKQMLMEFLRIGDQWAMGPKGVFSHSKDLISSLI